MILGKNGNQLNTINCLLIIGVIVLGMPLFTQKMTSLTISSASYAQNQWVTGSNWNSVAGSVIKENIVDLKKVDKNGTKSLETDKPYNDISVSNDPKVDRSWRTMNINAIMDWDTAGTLSKDWWGYELEDDNDSITPQTKGFMGIGKSYYYRYQVISWFNIILSLLIMVVAFFFALIKCARIIFEVAMAQVWMPFVAMTDIASGQRIKEGIKHFITLFFALFLCIALMGVFFAGNAYVSKLDYPPFIKVILQIALAWAIIDGPNILERILGVDIGLKSGWQMVLGAKAGADSARGTGKAAKGMAGMPFAAAKQGRKVAQGVAGKKTPKGAPPNDGKRHGGLAGIARGERFDGTSRSKGETQSAGGAASSEAASARAANTKTHTPNASPQSSGARPTKSNAANAGRKKSVIPPADRNRK